MSMPAGFKSEHGYATSKSLGGRTYHEISNIMIEKGFKMNHSTARNVFVNSLMKIAHNISELYNTPIDQKTLKRIAIDPRFQEAVAEYIREVDDNR